MTNTRQPSTVAETTAVDLGHLGVAYDVLTGLVEELDPANVDPADVWARLVRCRQAVANQLRQASAASNGRRPIVLDPARLAQMMSRQGQPLTPVITVGVGPMAALSSAEVRMPPHWISRAHVHHHTDVGLVLLRGQAVTLWWDDHATMHELRQLPGQHLLIPHGIVHAAINPVDEVTVGAEFRSNPDFGADTDLIAELQPQVTTRMAAILTAA